MLKGVRGGKIKPKQKAVIMWDEIIEELLDEDQADFDTGSFFRTFKVSSSLSDFRAEYIDAVNALDDIVKEADGSNWSSLSEFRYSYDEPKVKELLKEIFTFIFYNAKQAVINSCTKEATKQEVAEVTDLYNKILRVAKAFLVI